MTTHIISDILTNQPNNSIAMVFFIFQMRAVAVLLGLVLAVGLVPETEGLAFLSGVCMISPLQGTA